MGAHVKVALQNLAEDDVLDDVSVQLYAIKASQRTQRAVHCHVTTAQYLTVPVPQLRHHLHPLNPLLSPISSFASMILFLALAHNAILNIKIATLPPCFLFTNPPVTFAAISSLYYVFLPSNGHRQSPSLLSSYILPLFLKHLPTLEFHTGLRMIGGVTVGGKGATATKTPKP